MAVGLTVAAVLSAAFLLLWRLPVFAPIIALDFETYQVFAQRWLVSGSMYLPYQVAGPFDPQPLPHIPAAMPSMYPPPAALLFAPFLVLPAVLWWTIPLGVIAYAFARWRPAPWSWPLLAAVLLYQPTLDAVLVGNTTMWVVAALCGGLLWGWPAVLVALKPSLLPLVLVGIRRRSWWIAAGAGLGIALLFGGLWLEYLAVLRNAETSLAYSLGGWPIYVPPFIAWLARRPGPALRSRGGASAP